MIQTTIPPVDRSPSGWPYTGSPCPTCGRRLHATGTGNKCWPCKKRECVLCGEWHEAMFFIYCWNCERLVMGSEAGDA